MQSRTLKDRIGNLMEDAITADVTFIIGEVSFQVWVVIALWASKAQVLSCGGPYFVGNFWQDATFLPALSARP